MRTALTEGGDGGGGGADRGGWLALAKMIKGIVHNIVHRDDPKRARGRKNETVIHLDIYLATSGSI